MGGGGAKLGGEQVVCVCVWGGGVASGGQMLFSTR